MKKVILVTDEPMGCGRCVASCRRKRVGKEEYYWICHSGYMEKGALVHNIIDVDSETKPEWCPLKAIPQKREERYASEVGDRDSGFIDGWNACIDEILADNEGWIKMVEAYNK